MDSRYVAFGLSLRSSFPLPGMRRAEAADLPALDLVVEAPADLEARWSGPVGDSAWRGQLGDGEELKIERGVAGDIRFTYGERACFQLDPSATRLACAPREADALDWQRVLLTRVLPNVGIARGHEALHACAVESPLGVVAVAAASGTGKSTLAGELIRRGWPLFADDVLTLRRAGEAIEAQPATPHMNVSAADPRGDDLGLTLALLAGERWVAVRESSSTGSGVAAVAILERGPGLSLAAEPLPASPLLLAPFMLGLPDDSGRDASRFALYSDLVESARLLRLTGGPDDRPTDLADSLEQALGVRSARAAA